MIGINLYHESYDNLNIPANSIIYCDPPYKDTAEYKDKFDSDLFWEWCRLKNTEGHTIYISEYTAPDDFICVKEIEHYTGVTKKGRERTEKLFTLI